MDAFLHRGCQYRLSGVGGADVSWGERGPTGDHGQAGDRGRDGAPGAPGERGPAGAAGAAGVAGNDMYEDPAINEAIAEALGEKRVRSTDKRLLIIFGLLVASLAFVFWTLDRAQDRLEDTIAAVQESRRLFRAQIVENCMQVNEGNAKVNGLLQQLADRAATNTTRSPEENAEAVARYRGLQLPITQCPPSEG